MKFDVFAAFGRTFTTLFGNALDILRVAWLPAVLQLAAFFAFAPGFLEASTGLSADPPEDLGQGLSRLAPSLPFFLIFVAIALATAIILTAGIARLIVGLEKPALFLLRWGQDEWRILACWGLIAAAGICVALAFTLFRMVSPFVLSTGPIANLISFAVLLVIFLAGVWIAVRLSLFTPATIAGETIGIRMSWEKTEDLFWPIFGFWLLFIVFAIIIQFLTFGLVTPPAYFDAMKEADFRSPETVREAMRNANAAMAAGYDLSDPGNVVRMLISFLLNLAANIVFAVASAVAWKHLADPSAQA